MRKKFPETEFFQRIMKRIRDIPFPYVIEKTTGRKVLKLKMPNKVVDEIYQAAIKVIQTASGEDFSDLRPNEISNKLEDRLRDELRGSIPENKVAGYPDIMIERNNEVYYIEAKLAGQEQLNSSFRVFYYEPVKFSKVTRNAYHILVGFVHINKKINGFKLIDLSKIRVNLKSEFNTDNKELYKADAVVREYP